jgi:hypothetical protein
MNYEKNYNDYINYVKTLKRFKGDGNYYEVHHIKLKSLNGDDSKENLVLLTAREHYLAHYLLTKIIPCQQTFAAFWMFHSKNTKSLHLHYLNSRFYEWARLCVQTNMINNPPMKNEKSRLKMTKTIKNQYTNGRKPWNFGTENFIICIETNEKFSLLELSQKLNVTKERIRQYCRFNTEHNNLHYKYEKPFKSRKTFKVRCLETNKIYENFELAGETLNVTGQQISRYIRSKSTDKNGHHWERLD